MDQAAHRQSRASAPQRRRIRIRGLVQGVGFRPHVYRCASAYGLSGFVRNDPEGVLIEVEGGDVDAFIADLRSRCPPLARIDSLLASSMPLAHDRDFTITSTRAGAASGAAIPADTALCDACLGELFDPHNRRYLHPFIACCHCGPRYSMTRDLPYDRAATTMADFPMCGRCAREYADPSDRRFHAEPIACHDCGPSLSSSLPELACRLQAGDIVAIKGIGGYHLACDASNNTAVEALRARKQRDGKPFAVMVLNTVSASRLATLTAAYAELLESRERPVVVLEAIPQDQEDTAALSPAVSGGLATLGIMLPYTAVHYLLFHKLLGQPAGADWLARESPIALVMTSANISGDPLITDNNDAVRRLQGIADHLVHHDRNIAGRVDDSVLRALPGRAVLIRRARGYTPHAVPLARDLAPSLALGAHLKSTITMTRGERAYLSPHLGDLDTPATVEFLADSVDALRGMLQTPPQRLACDWARDFAATRLAEQLSDELDLPLARVQHHHAHVAAVLAEQGVEEPALGMALDGHGLGENGESWGGELLLVEGADFRRLGHFAPLPLIGGDRAAREPWRMAAGALARLGRLDDIASRYANEPLAAPVAQLLADGDYPSTTAAGRLFDAAAGLLAVCQHNSFEGEAPMLLDGLAEPGRVPAGDYTLDNGVLDFLPLLAELVDCKDAAAGSTLLHATLVEGLTDWAVAAAAQTGVGVIAVCGGCFLNRHLATALPQRLQSSGLRVLFPRIMPPGDGAISLGQAWVAQRSKLSDINR